MAKRFKEFLTNVFYQDENVAREETEKLDKEDVAAFEESLETVSDETMSEDVVEKARKIILDSQINSDNDEFPDISNIQTVLDTVAGNQFDNELIKKLLINLLHLEPDGLEKDGNGRRQAILDVINKTKEYVISLKEEKSKDEQNLIQAEKDAESNYTEAVTKANAESERQIEEEKARSAAIIADIRRKTEEATEAAKQVREETLNTIAAHRNENEAEIRKVTALSEETEKQGQAIINQIDIWLGYLK